MTIGQAVTILPNPIWPRLAGRTGIVVSITKSAKCYGATGCERSRSCGANYIVLVSGERYLVPKDRVTVIGEEAAA